MKLPTTNDIITGSVLLIVGVLIFAFLPTFSDAGWYAIFFGIAVFIFPGPQLRERYKQTEESKERWRQSAKAESSKNLSWWASPFPWALLICFVVVVLQSSHNKQILSPAKSAGCDVNPLRGFPR